MSQLDDIEANEVSKGQDMKEHDLADLAAGAASRSINRRTLLLGAAGGLTVIGIRPPARAMGYATSVAPSRGPGFDPELARRLQEVLHEALRDPSTHFPGAILHVDSPRLGSWTGASGLGRLAPAEPMRPDDRFRAGSVVKPFVSVVVLQLAESGRLSLDAPLPALLPGSVVRRFANASAISVRMLLSHRSGIPEWDTPDIDDYIAHHPAKIWTIDEKLDLAAAKPPVFPPGTSYKYCNTEYTLLGLIIERLTGRSWRREVTRRVIGPLGLGQHLSPHARAQVDRRPPCARLPRARRQDGGSRPASTRRWPAPPAAVRSSPPLTTSPASWMPCSRAGCSGTTRRCERC